MPQGGEVGGQVAVDDEYVGVVPAPKTPLRPAEPDRRSCAAKGLTPKTASVPLGLPRIPGSFHPRRRGAGHLLGAAERAEVQVRLGQAPPALSTTAGQRGRDREFPARRAGASSRASLAMRFSTAATGPGRRRRERSSPGRTADRDPLGGPGPAPMPVPARPDPAAMPPAKPCQDSPLPPACPDPLVDRHPPIAPAVFRKLDAVAVLTARSSPALLTLGPGWLCP